jgi:uncharacterized protein YecE (DUF72 family)
VDFGKLPSLDGVVFKLPAIDARSRDRLARGGGAGVVRVGAPVWARRDWTSKLYPRGTQPRDFLREYARRLGAIELNSSYYGVPEEAVVLAWCADTPETFRFCPKLHQGMTHERKLAGAEAAAEGVAFAARFATLGPRLGLTFAQLPPWFAPDRLAALDGFLAAVPMAMAIEFRHPAWFDFGALRRDAAEVLARRGAATVITDVAGRRDVCHATLTSSRVLVRFVGNAPHASDGPRVDAWADRAREWCAAGLDELYFFVHQPDAAPTPELIADVVARFNARAGTTLPSPLVSDPPPRQLRLF